MVQTTEPRSCWYGIRMTNGCLSYVVLWCCAAMVPELERFANVDLTVGRYARASVCCCCLHEGPGIHVVVRSYNKACVLERVARLVLLMRSFGVVPSFGRCSQMPHGDVDPIVRRGGPGGVECTAPVCHPYRHRNTPLSWANHKTCCMLGRVRSCLVPLTTVLLYPSCPKCYYKWSTDGQLMGSGLPVVP